MCARACACACVCCVFVIVQFLGAENEMEVHTVPHPWSPQMERRAGE